MSSDSQILKRELHNILSVYFSIFLSLFLSVFYFYNAVVLSLSLCGLWLPVVETVPPDLLTLTSACVKLRMTQRPPLQTCDASVFTILRRIVKFNRFSVPLSRLKNRRDVFFFLNGLSAPAGEDQWLCGTLGVAVHSACGLQQPACTTLQTQFKFKSRVSLIKTRNASCPTFSRLRECGSGRLRVS